jgi:hypothetical protein
MDIMRDIVSGALKEVVGFTQRGPVHLASPKNEHTSNS